MANVPNSQLVSWLRRPAVQRASLAIHAAMVIAYLAVITFFLGEAVRSFKGALILIFLWLLGLVALAFFWREWLQIGRNFGRTETRRLSK